MSNRSAYPPWNFEYKAPQANCWWGGVWEVLSLTQPYLRTWLDIFSHKLWLDLTLENITMFSSSSYLIFVEFCGSEGVSTCHSLGGKLSEINLKDHSVIVIACLKGSHFWYLWHLSITECKTYNFYMHSAMRCVTASSVVHLITFSSSTVVLQTRLLNLLKTTTQMVNNLHS